MSVKGSAAGGWLDDRVAQTRQELIERARDLFAERGYGATPLEEVVRRAGMTRGALYHHFDDKRALFEAVVDRVLRDTVDRVEFRAVKRAAQRGRERDADALELFLEELSEPAVHRVLCVDGPAALGRERWSALLGERLQEPVRRLVEGAVERGAVDATMADAVTPLLFGAVQEAALLVGQRRRGRPGPARREVEGALAWMLERLLGASG
jgi:AcrR family transcriptional regulator